MKSRGLDSSESWIVATCISVVFLLTTWPIRLGNQLFVSMLDHFETNRKSVSFSFVLTYLTRSVSGPFAGYFGNKFGLQNVCLCGCILSVIGTGGCFFARDINEMYIFFGVIYGIGFGWSTAVGPELVNQHFEKHRSKANGLVFGTSGLVAFITPPLLEIILKRYGVSGSFLVMSAILLNSIPAAMIISKRRSIKQIKISKSVNTSGTNEKECKAICKENKIANTEDFGNYTWKENEPLAIVTESATKNGLCILDDHNSKSIDELKVESLGFEKNVQISCSSIENGNKKVVNPPQRLNDVHIATLLQQSTETNNTEKSTKNLLKHNLENLQFKEVKNKPLLLRVTKLNDAVLSVYKEKFTEESKKREDSKNIKKVSKLASIDVLWSPIFLFITFIQSSHFYVMYLSWTITVDVIRDKGILPTQEVYFVMALALFDMIGRASLGILTDSGILSRANYNAICFGVMGTLCLVIPWVTGFITIIIVVSLLGLICGGNTTGLPGIINQFISEEKRAMAMSSRLLMYAPMSLTLSPLIGYFRGDLGSYNGLFYLVAILCFTCSFLLLILPRIKCLTFKKNLNTD